MKRTKITKQEPVVRELTKSKEMATKTPEPQKAEEAPKVERSMKHHKPASSMGLDDLFGFGGQDEGRMKMPKRTKKKFKF